MASFGELIRSLLEKVAQVLGGKGPDEKRLRTLDQMEEKLLVAKRDNTDAVDQLKADIRSREKQAVRKKRELDQTRGESKRVVVGEIERIFRGLDRLRGAEDITAANLDRIGLALAKVGEAKAALRRGAAEEQFDDIALEIQDLFSKIRDADQAARQLEGEQYAAPERSRVDVEKRMAEVQGEEATAAELSPETQKRLEQLETEST